MMPTAALAGANPKQVNAYPAYLYPCIDAFIQPFHLDISKNDSGFNLVCPLRLYRDIFRENTQLKDYFNQNIPTCSEIRSSGKGTQFFAIFVGEL